MIKRTLTTIITALVIAAVPALAGIVKVDFSSAGVDGNADLTNQTVDLNGHGDFGGPTTLYGIISVNYNSADPVNEQAGIQTPFDTNLPGGPGGISGMNFNTEPLWGSLTVNFNQLGVRGFSFTYTTDDAGVDGFFASPFGYDLDPQSNQARNGTFTYGSMNGTPDPSKEINSVSLAFNGTNFTIDSMEYNWVPEPASYLLFGTGLLGLGAVRRFRRGKA